MGAGSLLAGHRTAYLVPKPRRHDSVKSAGHRMWS
jgi:hypothetical protein